MAGIFPSNGVAAASTVNGVDVETVNCTELFYSVQRCQPRFDPAATNAMISEMLNLVSGAGLAYDCNRLDNLLLAVQALVGIKDAEVGVSIGIGAIVTSSDGDNMWNCSGVIVTPPGAGSITTAGLAGLGLCRLTSFATTATGIGVDSFGNVISVGDEVITFADGMTLVVYHSASGGQTNSFTSPDDTIINDGDNVNLQLRVDHNEVFDLAPNASVGEVNALTGNENMWVELAAGGLRKVPFSSIPKPPPGSLTAIGSYVWATNADPTTSDGAGTGNPGSTLAGNQIYFTSAFGQEVGTAGQTWRAQCSYQIGPGTSSFGLWVRIS